MYLKRSPHVALLLQMTFSFIYSIGLILRYYYWQIVKNKYIYIYIWWLCGFFVEIIVKNYGIFLIVSLLAEYCYKFFSWIIWLISIVLENCFRWYLRILEEVLGRSSFWYLWFQVKDYYKYILILSIWFLYTCLNKIYFC